MDDYIYMTSFMENWRKTSMDYLMKIHMKTITFGPSLFIYIVSYMKNVTSGPSLFHMYTHLFQHFFTYCESVCVCEKCRIYSIKFFIYERIHGIKSVTFGPSQILVPTLVYICTHVYLMN